MFQSRLVRVALVLAVLLVTAACNLTGAPEEPISNTAVPTVVLSPSATLGGGGIPTSVAVTGQPGVTGLPPATSIVQLPPTVPVAVTPGFISIFIVSPVPGNVIAGNVQVVGSAAHPDFLQYQLEFGPDPNPANLWYLIGGVQLAPVVNNVLGNWNTTDGRSPDGLYQLRLRVFLKDGTNTQTVVNNLRVQNAAPTLAPSATQSIPRPIAAFYPSPNTGKAPLVVKFTNLSSGSISGYSWNFGDGSTSSETNPVHTFQNPGTYSVRLTVNGPGGQSNVDTLIDVQTASPPRANFTANITTGRAPLNVQFTNTSTGAINTYYWDFGDGATSNEQNPGHRFVDARQYNVLLEVRGPGGTDRKRMTIVVENPQVNPPVADFIPRTASGNAPLTIQFADRSTGQVNTWEWDFGDGSGINRDQNPIHTYQSSGTYTVRLTTSGNGGQDSETGTITVNQAPQAPDAKFTANPPSGTAPLQVQFNSQSTGNITGYEWSFGDGSQTETAQNPIHTYQNPGTYTVRLTVYGQNNLFDFAETTISVAEPAQPPDAAFSVDKAQGSAPLSVNFINQSTGDNVTFAWDFGDGNTSNSQETQVNHVYQTNGVYTAILTVTNPQGQTDSASQVITVTSALQAAFDAAQLIDQPLTVQFTSTSTGDIARYNWNFGDRPSGQDGEAVITHTYASAGTYPVTLTIFDSSGASASITRQVTVNAPTPTPTTVPPTATTEPPTATIAAPTAAAPVASFEIVNVDGRTVMAVDRSTGEGLSSWAWDFGDGQGFSAEQNPLPYTYAQAGTYQITLTVAGTGGQATTSQSVTVVDPIPRATANFSFASGDQITFQFTDLSQPAETITAWYWDFGELGIKNDQAPVVTFPRNGDFPVTLVVTNAAGTSDPTTQIVTVTGHISAPVADFTFDSRDQVTFQFNDTSQSAGTITALQWDFGEFGTSSERTPVVTFPRNGDFPVTLVVTNAAGASAPTTKTVTVTGNLSAPVADFTFDSRDQVTFQFNDTSQPAGTITTWQWDFGEFGTSSEPAPVVTFPRNGDFPVTLTVTNAAGASAPTTKTVTVTGVVDQPQPTEPPTDESPVDTTPILPDIAALTPALSRIVANGNTDPNQFALAGDNSARQDGFLRAFADGSYSLDGDAADLETLVQTYLASGSFERAGSSLAVSPDYTVSMLVNDPAPDCGGETLFTCELAQTSASVVVISVGLRDVLNGTDAEAFRADLNTLVRTAAERGVIPVLLTIYPRADVLDGVKAFNEIIIEVANDNSVPVINVWRGFNDIGSGAMDGNNPSVGGGSADVLTGETITSAGENARNYYVLRVLAQLQDQLFARLGGRR